jgi:hypothetical protein
VHLLGAFWSNLLLVFDHCLPALRPVAVSYVDAVLNPIADAIAKAASSTTQIWLTMQGEMGVSGLFSLPHAG